MAPITPSGLARLNRMQILKTIRESKRKRVATDSESEGGEDDDNFSKESDAVEICDDLEDLKPDMITKKIKVKIVRRFVCKALRDRVVEFIFAYSKFRDVNQGLLDPNYCVDLIGRLVRTIDLRAFDSLGFNHRFYFQIEDKRFINRCANCVNDVKIIIIRFAKLELFEGKIHVTATEQCTQFLSNHDYRKVQVCQGELCRETIVRRICSS
ncbi:unnamed protein product [Arabidopsis thaliana]|uniref:Uncharacterized protein n=1 Tax=Arabidopsis thaliana TaxID=3702 RepID=Q9LHP6_ARATH|nr:unnamed protein product [Arabidopsis thaliana]